MTACLTAAILLCTILTLPSDRALASNVGDSLTVGIQSTRTLLIDPLEPIERDMLSVYRLVYESLISIDDDYMPQPLLAESWEESGDGRTWTFHIRTGATFSDGSPLTAQDVVATANYIIERAKDETAATKGYYSNLDYFVSRITASDERTVVVRTPGNRAYYGILYAMTFPVLKQSELGQTDPTGSGPYIISGFEPGRYLYLDANVNWWKATPKVSEINFSLYDTQTAVMESYEYGRVNTIFTRATAAAQYSSGQNSLTLSYRTNQIEVLLMNQSYSKLKSANVRLAIRHAIDPGYILSNIYLNMGTRTNLPAIPGTWTYDADLDAMFTYDPELSRRLLAEDGWADSNEDGILDKLGEDGKLIEMTLRLLVYEEPDNDVRFEAATYIRNQLAQIGIDAQIVTTTYSGSEDNPGALERLKAGSFHLALCAYALDPCPDPGFCLIGGNTYNYSRYRSQAMTDLCNELRACYTHHSYRDKLMQIERLFAEDCPFVCLYFRGGAVLTRYMYTTVRDVRELELLRGIESFRP